MLLANTPTQAKSLLHNLEQTASGIGLYVKADKIEDMCFNQRRDICSLNGGFLKLVDKFTYLERSVSSTENDINMQLAKARTGIDLLSIIWKSDLSSKIQQDFFQAVVVSILLYGCTKWMLNKRIEKKLDENCTRMLWAILNKSWKQQQLYSNLSSISKIIQIRWTRHAKHCWRTKDELISDVLPWTLHMDVQMLTTALYGHRMYLGRPTRSDGWSRGMVRESQGNPC